MESYGIGERGGPRGSTGERSPLNEEQGGSVE